MKVKNIIISFVLLVSLIAMPALAATPEEIEQSIVDGLAWLVGVQNTDGSWGGSYRIACTGFAVMKLEDRAFELGYDSPFDPAYPYNANVIDGLNYLFRNAYTIPISPQLAGNPDTNSNNIGVYITSGYYIYDTGIALTAIARSRSPSRTVNTSGTVNGWTYAQVVQDMVDYLAWAQTDSGLGRGGWRYSPNYPSSDNSISGYAVLGLDFAESSVFGSTVPAFVKSELNIWIDYIQNDVNADTYDGGSGYSLPYQMVNILKTGNLIYQMAFYGDTETTQRVIDAVDYIERYWSHPSADPGFRPHHYQAMYCLMKGFERMGIETINVGGSDIDWFDEISTIIVNSRNPNGSWPSDYWADYFFSTGWALLTLEKVTPNSPPVADAGEDQTVEQAYTSGADVTLDGSGSYDPDGDEITYSWTWSGDSATGVNPVISLPLGDTTVTLVVNDGIVDSDEPDTVVISIVDTTPPIVDAGSDVTVEQTSFDGAPAELPTPMVEDICDPAPAIVISGAMAIYPLGDTVVTVTATDASGNTASDIVVVHVVDTTEPELWCVETVNPHGDTIPGKNRSDNAKSKGKNPDGFYQLLAEDICDPEPEIHVGVNSNPNLFGPFASGVVIKFTEAPGAAPSMKKIGSSKGQAGAVTWHITLPSDPVITAVDDAGNVQTCTNCLVPPPLK